MTRKDERSAGLDFIRATAIILVLITHYSKLSPVSGVLGVELFFVLSGFLIGGILYRTIQFQKTFEFADLRRFWVRRWLRTLPNYYLFLVIFVVYTNNLTDRPVYWRDTWRYLFFFQNFAWPVPAFYGISWSLAVEEWFYLLFPAGFYLVHLLTGKHESRKRLLFMALVAFFFIFSMTLRFWKGEPSNWSLGMRTTVIYRFDALMFGVILAVIKQDYAPVWERLEKSFPIGVVLLFLGAFLARGAHSAIVPSLPAACLLTIIPAAFALILPGIVRWMPRQTIWTGAILAISKCSYSMYLCHWPILWLIMQAADDPVRGWAGKLSIRVLSLTGTVVCSVLLYRYFERPILRLVPIDKYSPLKQRDLLAPIATNSLTRFRASQS